MAPGCVDSIVTGAGIMAASNGSQGYTGKCGTSMAAPVVSGIIALMMQSYSHAFGADPGLYPSTYKSLLVQTARDMIKTEAYNDREFNNPDSGEPLRFYAGPDFATGYGLVDADAAVRAIADNRLWKQAVADATGEVDTYCIGVPDGAGEIKITLAWDDEPGTILTSITTSKLVNDLDLELRSPSDGVTLPWTLDPLPVSANPGDGALDPISTSDITPARRDVDRRNNVEMASVPLPEMGEWKVRVRAFHLPNANPQPYSLVASLPFKTLCN
jgi:subtilisin family serine protease